MAQMKLAAGDWPKVAALILKALGTDEVLITQEHVDQLVANPRTVLVMDEAAGIRVRLLPPAQAEAEAAQAEMASMDARSIM